jgi:hypothetical protein
MEDLDCNNCNDLLLKNGFHNYDEYAEKVREITDSKLRKDLDNCKQKVYVNKCLEKKVEPSPPAEIIVKEEVITEVPSLLKPSRPLPFLSQLMNRREKSMETPILDRLMISSEPVTKMLECGPRKVFRSGYTRANGTVVGETCAKKSRRRKTKSGRRRRVSGGRRRKTKSKSCGRNSVRRRGYTRASGKRVKSTCAKKPLKCSPKQSRRRAHVRSNGKKVKSTCVKKSRRRRS